MDPKTLRQLEQLLKNALKNVASKDDLKSFASKDDLKNFATKDDLKNFATKDDLKTLKNELKEYIDQSFNDVFESTDKNKADKSDLIRLARRIEKLERKVFSN